MYAPDRLSNLSPQLARVPSKSEVAKVVQEKMNEIRTIRLAYRRLAARERQLRKEIVEQRALRAPISTVPVEVISRIFTLSIDLAGCGLPSEPATQSIYRLMLVCKLWCTIAVGTPQLWTRFQLTPEIDIPYLPTWLRRSGDLPLDISIPVVGCDHVPLPTEALGNSISRLQTLLINLPVATEVTPSRMRTLLNSVAVSSNITDITIDFAEVDDKRDEARVQEPIRIPSLRNLGITRCYFPFALVSPKLEMFVIGGSEVFTEDVWKMVSSSRSLQRLDLIRPSIIPYIPSNGEMSTQLSTVQELSLVLTSDDPCYLNILRSCPNVDQLLMMFMTNTQFTKNAPASVFKNITRLALSILTAPDYISFLQMADPDNYRPIVSWIQASENLVDLTIGIPNSTLPTSFYDCSLLLQMLIGGNNYYTRMPCPRLRVLRVDGHVYWPSVLLRIMLERSASIRDIKRVGYNPNFFPHSTETSKKFNLDIEVRLAQRKWNGSTQFRGVTSQNNGWVQFYNNFWRHTDSQDKTYVYKLGALNPYERLDFMCDKNEEFRARFNDQGPMNEEFDREFFGKPDDYPPDPMKGFVEAFEKAFGLDQPDESDEDDTGVDSDTAAIPAIPTPATTKNSDADDDDSDSDSDDDGSEDSNEWTDTDGVD